MILDRRTLLAGTAGAGAALLTGAPGQPGQPMAYRQGVISAWNPVTLANTVEVDGATFTDLPVLGLAEAASYQVGSTVGLVCVGSREHGKTWAILGIMAVPGSDAAADAVERLSGRIVTGFVSTAEAVPVGAFADLPSFGPEVVIDVPASGQVLVILGAQMQVNADGLLYGYEVSGANTIAASSNNDLFFRRTDAGSNSLQGSLVDPLTGLTPGSTKFTAKYTASVGGGNLISRRRLTVVAL